MEFIEKVKSLGQQNINKEGNTFDNFIKEFEFTTYKPSNLQELKDKYNKKIKGDLFEAFCYLYLKNILNHDSIWFYKDFPYELKQQLNLTKNDYGIDIVSKKDNEFYAIQCKYKKPSDKIQLVSWRSLSTFYALTSKSGPWKKHIVMTNINGCRHIGKKSEQDLSICIKTFQNLNHFDWLKLLEINEKNTLQSVSNKIIDENKTTSNPDLNQLRELRLKFLEKK